MSNVEPRGLTPCPCCRQPFTVKSLLQVLPEPEIKALNWVDGSWWDVETVPAGVKCYFEEGSTLVVPVNEKQKQGTYPNEGI